MAISSAVFYGGAAWLLALAAEAISVASLSKLHNDCNDSVAFELADGSCADSFRPTWWALMFQLAVLAAILAVACLKWIRFFRVALVFMLVMAASVVMDQAEATLAGRDARRWREIESKEEAFDGMLAGLILLSVADWVMVFVIGTMGLARAKGVPRPGLAQAAE
ncbi:unnamed protein product [Ostreobium quekettii]|uniref:Uncharacterized protein n=1 Tax=Ostreobium quekettii TaxID=121088 RepID=A0A8S1ILQ0_9CHLO|nr:unnamed protein product [Ostreobium quekettii]